MKRGRGEREREISHLCYCILHFDYTLVPGLNRPLFPLQSTHMIFSPYHQVHGWEPVALHDNLSLQWGRVADMAVYNDQLVSCS